MNLRFSERSDGVITVFYHWNLSGLWFEGKTKLYYLYSLILHSAISYFYSITMFLGIFNGSNLISSTEGIYASFSDMIFLFKVNVILLQQSRYRTLYQRMYNELQMINDDDVHEKQLIERGRKRSKLLLYTVLTSYYIALIFVVLKPLFSKEQELPFQTMYPFEWKGTTYVYYSAYFYQFIGILLQVSISAGVDTIPSSVMILICEYCEVINYNMTNLGISEFSNTDEKRHEVLKRVARNYIVLNKILKQLEDGFSLILFMQFCISTIVMCTTAFQMSVISVTDHKVEFLFMVSYMVAMIIQIFIPCYFGNQLFLTSRSLTDSLYNSNWIYFDSKFNKNIVLFREILKKPMIMRGGNIELKLSAFLSTINFAYSVYNLLHRIQSKVA